MPAGLVVGPALLPNGDTLPLGSIQGTPLVVTPATKYSVTVSNAGGYATTQLMLQVNDGAGPGRRVDARCCDTRPARSAPRTQLHGRQVLPPAGRASQHPG